jgi:hypothetical protein
VWPLHQTRRLGSAGFFMGQWQIEALIRANAVTHRPQ